MNIELSWKKMRLLADVSTRQILPRYKDNLPLKTLQLTINMAIPSASVVRCSRGKTARTYASRQEFPDGSQVGEKRDQIRQKLEANSRLYWLVKGVANLDILHGILEPDEPLQSKPSFYESRGGASRGDGGRGGGGGGRGRGNGNASELPAPENAPVAFGNVAMFANTTYKRGNLLRLSATFDSECSNHLTWDKSRFIGEITPAYEWVSTPDDDLLIEGLGTMLMHDTLKGKKQSLHFRSTAYVLDLSVTLISVSKLKKKEFL